jgi:phosphatidylethanolamine/phosphatidyl-N-methylethanolamine N-methyltransferase
MTIDGSQYWDRHAKSYDRLIGRLCGSTPRVLETVERRVAGTHLALEVGAGSGLFSTAIAPHVGQLVATDYSPGMVALLKTRIEALKLNNVRVVQADIYSLTFPPGSFDTVVAANVLHLVPDLPGAIAALRQMLRPGGRFIAPTFCHDETPISWTISRALALTGFPGHRRFSAASFCSTLERVGLQIDHRQLVRGLIPIMYVDGRLR